MATIQPGQLDVEKGGTTREGSLFNETKKDQCGNSDMMRVIFGRYLFVWLCNYTTVMKI